MTVWTALLPVHSPLSSLDRAHRRPAVLGVSSLLSVIVVLVFFLPARAVVSGVGAAGRPHLILAVGLLLWWLVSLVHPHLRTGRLQPLVVLVLAYTGWLVLAWAAGYDRGLTDPEANGSDRAMIAAFAYLGIVLVAALGLTTRSQIDRVLRVAVVGAAFSALMGWVQFWLGRDYTGWLILPGLQANGTLVGISERGTGDFARVAGTAGHYIEFGVVMAMLLPLAVHYALARPKGQRALRWTYVVVIGGAIPFSLSRSALIAFALSTIVMLLGWPRRTRWNAVGVIVLAIPVYMAIKPGLLGTIKSLFVNAANDPSITGRTEDYAAVLGYVAERPIIGRGPGTFTPEVYRLLDNQWLLSLIEIGWVGVTLFALTLIVCMRTLMTIRRRALFIGDARQADLALCLLAIVVTLAVTSAFFDTFSFTSATTVLWLTVGVTAALSTVQRSRLTALGIAPMSVAARFRALVQVARGHEEQLGPGGWL